MTFKSPGLILSSSFPVFGASPDAINDDFVVEIKCPMNERSYLNYLNARGEITPKCYAQIQLQMKLSGKKKGLFCIAAPDFEKSKKVKIVNVLFDPQFLAVNMRSALRFWKRAIGTKILSW